MCFTFTLACRNFSEARRHGKTAVSTIERYDELTRKINNSLELSKQANHTVNELLLRVSTCIIYIYISVTKIHFLY